MKALLSSHRGSECGRLCVDPPPSRSAFSFVSKLGDVRNGCIRLLLSWNPACFQHDILATIIWPLVCAGQGDISKSSKLPLRFRLCRVGRLC